MQKGSLMLGSMNNASQRASSLLKNLTPILEAETGNSRSQKSKDAV